MKVLLSIKPEFANKIFDGSKKFEFRRLVFKNKDVKKIVVYASAPISKVIGEFDVDEVLYRDIDDLWNDTKEHSGITKDYYESYFVGKEKGYAIKVKNSKRYAKDYCLMSRYGVKPPQSFLYLR
ncbi:MAG: hypothetical protein GQ574_25015 [Crocinitomix sp.]|nr:hypothetical protein [Crocinitomix sp.]